jgi:hypothetical protein
VESIKGSVLKLVYQRDENELSAIESGFPHIAKQLCTLWGKPQCVPYMDTLLTYSGGDNSKGLPMEVVEELFWLFTMLHGDNSGRVVSAEPD